VELAEVPEPESLIDLYAPRRADVAVLGCDLAQLGLGARHVVGHGAGVYPIGDKRLGHAHQRRGEGEPDPEIPVREGRESGIETTHLSNQGGRHHDAGRASGHDIASEQRVSDVRLARAVLWAHDLQVGVHKYRVSARPGSRRSSGQGGELREQLGWGPDVVVVDERHPGSGRPGHSGVAGRGDALPLAVTDHDQARVREGGEVRTRVVPRPVVDDDDLNVNALLCQDRAQRSSEEAPAIPRRDHHGNVRGIRSVRDKWEH